MLDVLQISHNRENHNNQQRPGDPLANMNNRPGTHLIRILPDADIRERPQYNANSCIHNKKRRTKSPFLSMLLLTKNATSANP